MQDQAQLVGEWLAATGAISEQVKLAFLDPVLHPPP
jgi:hypothetical protein